MICDKCNITMDEEKIFGYFINGNLENYCSKCTPYREEGQLTINSFDKKEDRE